MAISPEFRKELNKVYGLGTVASKSEGELLRIPTGIFNLDAAIEGGISLSRVHLFVGEESGGKTITSLRVCANAQKIDRFTHKPLIRTEEGVYVTEDGEVGNPMQILYLDPEGSVTLKWAETIGVDTNEDIFVLVNIGFLEEAYDIFHTALESGEFDVIVLDSLASMAPEAELEASASDFQMGVAARGNNKGIRGIQANMNKTKKKGRFAPAIILVNQLREKVGIAYGNPTVYPGGKGQKYASSLTVEFRAGKPVEANGEMVARSSKWKITKSKLGGLLTEGEFKTYIDDAGPYQKGDTDAVSQVLDVAIRLGIVTTKGAWVYWPNGEQSNGKSKAEVYLFENPEYYKEIKKRVEEALQAKI